MPRSLIPTIALSALLASPSAFADRGALSFDLGGGMALQNVAAPYTQGAAPLLGFDPTFQLGARYALTNMFELTLEGWFEIPATYFHNNVNVVLDGKTYSGTLQHNSHRYGALAGVRAVFGYAWRPFVGLEVGWAHRSFDDLKHIDDRDPATPIDYQLDLKGTTRDNLTAAAYVGLQWVGDNFSVSLSPRFDYVIGIDAAWTLTLPLTIGWSFYL